MAIGPQCELLTLQPLGVQHLALLQGATGSRCAPGCSNSCCSTGPNGSTI